MKVDPWVMHLTSDSDGGGGWANITYNSDIVHTMHEIVGYK